MKSSMPNRVTSPRLWKIVPDSKFRKHATEYHRLKCDNCHKDFSSKSQYLSHTRVIRCKRNTGGQERESARGSRPYRVFVTDIAARQNVEKFLDVTPGKDSKTSWLKAYEALFPSEPLPSESMSYSLVNIGVQY